MSVSWDCEFPSRSSSSLGSQKPKALLRLQSEEGGLEELDIPVTVARALQNLDAKGTLDFATRQKFLEQLQKIVERCAFERLIRMLDHRDYASKQAHDKLQQDGYTNTSIATALAHATQLNFLNDKRFAESFIRSKLAAGWGQHRIARELKQQGIDVHELFVWPDEFISRDTERQQAYALIASRSLPEKNPYQKLVRKLVSRGYAFELASDVVKEFLASVEDDEDDVDF